jgi:hypothetical protein
MIARWSQGIGAPKLECGDRIGFQGCFRKNMNNHLEKIFGEDHMLGVAEREDDKPMWDNKRGDRDIEDGERGQGFHADTRNRIDQMTQAAKDECKNGKTCCKTISICPRTSDPDISTRMFNNLNHYRIQDGYVHADVVKKNIYEYVKNVECIKIDCNN